MNYCTEVLYTILDYAFETLQLLLKKRFKINTGRAFEVSGIHEPKANILNVILIGIKSIMPNVIPSSPTLFSPSFSLFTTGLRLHFLSSQQSQPWSLRYRKLPNCGRYSYIPDSVIKVD